jgi:predicted nucleic acid-binding protein
LALYAVIYDACVLYPAPLRDILVELAAAHLFRAQWSEKIHEEWIRAVLRKRPELKSRLERTKQLMNTAIMDSCVTGYEHLIETITLEDPDDRHVVAAAMHARSDAIVTFNLKDFPASVLGPLHLEAIHPDDFITFQIDLCEAAVLAAANKVCRRLRNPPKTGKQFLEGLLLCGLPKTVAALRPYEELLSPSTANTATAVSETPSTNVTRLQTRQ